MLASPPARHCGAPTPSPPGRSPSFAARQPRTIAATCQLSLHYSSPSHSPCMATKAWPGATLPLPFFVVVSLAEGTTPPWSATCCPSSSVQWRVRGRTAPASLRAQWWPGWLPRVLGRIAGAKHQQTPWLVVLTYLCSSITQSIRHIVT